MNTYEFTIENGINLHADVHRARESSGQTDGAAPAFSKSRRRASVLYFHGGGLLCGTRDDVTFQYLEMFTDRGYNVYCFDYPLAPECTLGQIHQAALSCLKWFLERESGPYYLFGRSAGAYLALYLAHTARLRELPAPVGILSFYGYPGLLAPEFSKPSAYYQKFLTMDASIVGRLTDQRGRPVTYGPLRDRYLLYVYARQTGKWLELLLGGQEDPAKYSLTPEDLALLPPAFLTASSTDQDVPFGISKRMARQIPGSCFCPVYNLEHDFDRDTGRPQGRETYARALEWMAGLPDEQIDCALSQPGAG